jgi:RNA polymerase sigma-70 factor (ECF subfamily)
MNALNTKFDEIRQTADLVRAAQAGDRDAFGLLFERYQPAVLAIAMRRLGNYSEAQELTQDVFIQAMTKLHQLQTPACFIAWLRQITVRMAINRIVRSEPATAVEPEFLEATLTSNASPLEHTLQREQHEELRAGLGRLRRLDRETLTAFYVHGHSLLQMSDHFEAPVGTIKRRLHVARKRLAKEVDQSATA